MDVTDWYLVEVQVRSTTRNNQNLEVTHVYNTRTEAHLTELKGRWHLHEASKCSARLPENGSALSIIYFRAFYSIATRRIRNLDPAWNEYFSRLLVKTQVLLLVDHAQQSFTYQSTPDVVDHPTLHLLLSLACPSAHVR
jgi:hypothetical protein